MMYELITGRPPYYNPYKEKLFKNILNAKLRFKRSVSPVAKDLITKVNNFRKMGLCFLANDQRSKEKIRC